MPYTNTTTLYLLLLTAIAAIAYLLHHYRKLARATAPLYDEIQALELGNYDYRNRCILDSWNWPEGFGEGGVVGCGLTWMQVQDFIDKTQARDIIVLDPNRCDRCGKQTNEDPFLCDSCVNQPPDYDPAEDIFGGDATGYYATDERLARQITKQPEDYASNLLITREVIRSDGMTPSEYWICRAGCGTRLRYHEPLSGKTVCSVCQPHGHWVEELLNDRLWRYDIGYLQAERRGFNPHKPYVAVPRFGSRDETLGCSYEELTMQEAIEMRERELAEQDDPDSCFDRTYDAHVYYLPPLHGPTNACWVPVNSRDFAPAADDHEDIPF